MFFETKVLDPSGNLKRIVTAQELQTRHWKMFQQQEEGMSFQPKKTSTLPKRKKKINKGDLWPVAHTQ